jgi:chromosome partitioning protein
VINRASPRGRLADALAERIDALGAAIAETTIGNRTSLAASMLEGRGVIETEPRGKAAEEMIRLMDEITARLA